MAHHMVHHRVFFIFFCLRCYFCRDLHVQFQTASADEERLLGERSDSLLILYCFVYNASKKSVQTQETLQSQKGMVLGSAVCCLERFQAGCANYKWGFAHLGPGSDAQTVAFS